MESDVRLRARQLPMRFEVPDVPAFHFFLSTAARYPKNVAFVYHRTLITYEEWQRLSRQFAAKLSGWIKKGDRVAIYMPNCPQFAIAYMAILMAGGVFVSCNPMLTPYELDYQLRDSCVEIMVTTEDLLTKVRQCRSFSSLKQIIVARPHEECTSLLTAGESTTMSKDKECLSFRDMVNGGDDFRPVEIAASRDIAHIMYTGGTTGIPKGVIHTHANVVAAIFAALIMTTAVMPKRDEQGYWFTENDPKDLTPEWEYPFRVGRERALIMASWTHVMGLIHYLHQPIALAVKMLLLDHFDAGEFLRRLEEWEITWAGGSPTIIAYLLSHPNFEATDLSSLKVYTTGGSSLPEEHYYRFKEKIQGVIVEGYGLTESVPAACRTSYNRSSKMKIGSVGKVWPNLEVKVVDEIGQEVPAGQVGELIFKGPQVSSGYLNQPKETENTFRGGWLFTGDLARIDEEGDIFIVDRKKEMIIYKSYNVYPRELEEIMHQHPAVKECAVVGKKDLDTGEIPVAFVSCRTRKANAEDIKRFVNERVAPYKKIREIHLMEELPLSGSGKILKRELIKCLDS